MWLGEVRGPNKFRPTSAPVTCIGETGGGVGSPHRSLCAQSLEPPPGMQLNASRYTPGELEDAKHQVQPVAPRAFLWVVKKGSALAQPPFRIESTSPFFCLIIIRKKTTSIILLFLFHPRSLPSAPPHRVMYALGSPLFSILFPGPRVHASVPHNSSLNGEFFESLFF